MEPFRQIVDVWVYDNLRHQEFLKYEYRLGLTDLLNAKNQIWQRDLFSDSCYGQICQRLLSNIFRKKDSSKFHCPVVSSLEWSGK